MTHSSTRSPHTHPRFIRGSNLIGITLVIIGSFGHFFEQPYFKYIFSIGALLVIISHMLVMFQTKESDYRNKRMLRMQLILSLLLALSAYSMFDGTTLWIVTVLIYALVTLFLSFR